MSELVPAVRGKHPTLVVLDDVARERARQEQLVAAGKFAATCAAPSMHDADRLAVLLEEVGEVATAMLHARGENETGPEGDGLREELVQVAAVAVAWVESLDAPVEAADG